MNKLEFQRRLDDVETLIADGKYTEAVNECDRLNLDLLDQPRVLQNIAKAYEKCRRYADAEDLLLMAREIAPKSRGILFHLCSVSIKAGELQEAKRYYDEFEKRAKYDTQRYVLQYRIARAENKPDEELIRILSELCREEPDDRWMFELARLQAKNGMLEESRQTCEDIDLWFNSGKYVAMAHELHAQLLGEAYSAEDDAAAADASAEEDSGPLPELVIPLPGIPSPNKPETKEKAPAEVNSGKAKKEMPREDYESILKQETREIPSVRITSESEEIPPIEFDFSDIAETIDEVQAEKKAKREEEEAEAEAAFDRERDILEYGNTVAYKPEDEEDREGFRKAETVIVRRRDEEEELIEAESAAEAAEILEEEEEEEQPDPAKEAALQALRDKEERSARPEDWRRIVFGEDSVTDSGAEEKDTEEHVVFSVTRDSAAAVNPDTGMLPITEEEDDREIANPIFIDFPEEVAAGENKAAENTSGEEASGEDASAETASVENAAQENTEQESVQEKNAAKETESAFAAAVKAGVSAEETAKEEAQEEENFDAQITFAENTEGRRTQKSFRESAQEQIDALVNDLDEPIEEQDDVSLIVTEIAKRKKDEQLFGNLPIDPDVDEHIWHFIVYGETNTLTLDCAREHMKEISEVIPNCPGKMLKISSDRIGNANIVNSIDRFLGSMVVVEQAASLSDQQLRDFAKILDKDDRSLLVIFTDTRDDIIEMFRRVPALKDSFTAVFEGKIYNARDLVNAAKEYLYSQGAKFAREADPVVYEKARELLGAGRGYYKSEMRDYSEKALKQAEKGGFLGMSGGKVDRDGYLIVTEKHLKRAERR